MIFDPNKKDTLRKLSSEDTEMLRTLRSQGVYIRQHEFVPYLVALTSRLLLSGPSSILDFTDKDPTLDDCQLFCSVVVYACTKGAYEVLERTPGEHGILPTNDCFWVLQVNVVDQLY
jgi:hypothetical protein